MNHRHRFSAHVRNDGAHVRSFLAEADSFIDAAVCFAETLPAPEGEISIVVTDCDTGRERCFSVDLATGEVDSC